MTIQRCVLSMAICALSFTAVADSSRSDTARENIATDGYTEVSTDFFLKRAGTKETYMAVGRAGNQAMVELLIEKRNATQQAIENKGGNAAMAVAQFDGIINELNAPEPKVSGSLTGDCNGSQGSPDFYVDAQASGGTFAVSNAGNYLGIINTENRSKAWTVNKGGFVTSVQDTTTFGATPSHAQVSIPNTGTTCESHALASVKCPGHATPNLSIFVTELKWWDCRN